MEPGKALVENLIARLEPSPHGSGFVWNGIITEQEVAALRKLAGLAEPVAEVLPAPAIGTDVTLDTGSLESELESDFMLCLDFGTAFSKAAATSYNDELLELGLGQEAGEPTLQFPVHSTMYVTGERVWFGPQALDRSLAEADPRRRRFESPKQQMSQGDLESLKRQVPDEGVNTSSIQFSKYELIQLYLAYLTDLATTQIARHGCSRTVRRRFARPCWAKERALRANAAFREMLGKGQIIADTLHGEWAEGLPLHRARAVLDRIESLPTYRRDLVDQDVVEATAAASGALKGVSGRSIFLVADVGAGTCDFGLFFVAGGQRIAEMAGSTQVLRRAGDHIDELLLAALLARAHVDSPIGRGSEAESDFAPSYP
jgi:hypothetical protein